MGALILVRQNRNRNGSGSRSNIRLRAVFRKESAWNYVVVEHVNSMTIFSSSFKDDLLKLLGGEHGFRDFHSFGRGNWLAPDDPVSQPSPTTST